MADYRFRWLERRSPEYTDYRPCRRSHRDPTADVAIGNVMREERMKKKQEREQRMPSTKVWRAEKRTIHSHVRGDSKAGSGKDENKAAVKDADRRADNMGADKNTDTGGGEQCVKR